MIRSKFASRTASGKPAPWSWAIAGAALGLVLTLVFQAPARWLTDVLQQASQGRVKFQQVRGTVWSGSARLTLTGGVGSQDAATLPGNLNWRLRPGLSGLMLELDADCCMQDAWRVSLQPRWGGATVTLADSVSQWPAELLTGLGTPWNTIQAQGQLSLRTEGFALDLAAGRVALNGRAQLDAAQISSRLTTVKPMGSYRLILTGGAAPAFVVNTLEGSLQLSGSGQWVGSRLRFEGVASAAPDRLEALSNLLNILGRRDGARSIIKLG